MKKKIFKGLKITLCVLLGFSICFTAFWLIAAKPETVEPVFSQGTSNVKKEKFDEGNFKMGKYDLIVSVDGNDNADGTLENPLKTLKGAKEKLKTLKVPKNEKITVWFREGTYTFLQSLIFDKKDRGNVLYRSYPDEKVVFSGSKEITGNWETTKINDVEAFVIDMPIEGDDDYFRSLFKDGERLSRPNFPKEDVFKVAAEPNADEKIDSDWDANYFVYSPVFYAHPEDLLDFANPTDIDVKLMHFWCEDLLPVDSIDVATGKIVTRKPTAMKTRVDDNYILENVKEALTLPGEWYLDRTEEKLYYIPQPGDTPENTVLYAGANEQFITFDGAKNIDFQGIDFENTDWNPIDGKFVGNPFDSSHSLYKTVKYGVEHPQAAFEVPAAIYISNSAAINFTDCKFQNISYTAIKFEKASADCEIKSCLFNEIGGNAIFIDGEFVVPATTKNIDVIDCHIGNYGRIFNNAIGILLTHAIDCDLTHNEIHDGWYTGISVGWNWGYTDNPTNNINISNNLIYNIGNAWLSDMGGIYTLGIQPDTIISGNIIHNVGCDEGAYGYGGWGIYLDEGSSGITVEKNLVYDCSSQTFHQHYGKDNMIRNNIFAFGGEGQFRITRREEHNSLFLYNNIFVGNDTPMYFETTGMDWFKDNQNLYWDYATYGKTVHSGSSTNIFESENIWGMYGRDYYKNGVFADPLFKDVENRDFTLAENSPALKADFEPWEYNAGTITEF